MKTVVLLAQKGGVGKTTIAVHLASAIAKKRQRVVLVDTDPQESAMTWGRMRTNSQPVVVKASAHEIHKVLEAARQDRMDWCVIDTPPHAVASLSEPAKAADLIIIPLRPNAFDTATIPAAVEIVRASGKPAVFVLSDCPPRAPEVKEAREILTQYGFPVLETEITERRVFARAVAGGKAVIEFDPHGRAAAEIDAFYKELRSYIS